MKILVAIDDTDNLESIGTGKLARRLAAELERAGLVHAPNVTRHQLLVHPDVPYTSHNSCACIEGTTTHGDLGEIAYKAKAFMVANFHQGANPGLCIVREGKTPPELYNFGLRAQREVIGLDEGRALANRVDAYTWSTGKTGQGCIGALAGIGLRSGGMDGRFIALDGIREITGVITVGELLRRTAVSKVETVSGHRLPESELVDTQNWVRPMLRNWQAVLLVRKNGTCWHPAERPSWKDKKVTCSTSLVKSQSSSDPPL